MKASLDRLIAVAARHAETETGQDLEAIIATMEGEPVYEFYPIGKGFTGMANTRRYYRHFIDDVQARMVGAVERSNSVGPAGVVQEYDITLTVAGATAPSTHRIMALLTFGENGLTGERMYSDDALFRTLLGPLWDELETITPKA